MNTKQNFGRTNSSLTKIALEVKSVTIFDRFDEYFIGYMSLKVKRDQGESNLILVTAMTDASSNYGLGLIMQHYDQVRP
jgi:hypothetical protein